jgi:hypothetical protein
MAKKVKILPPAEKLAYDKTDEELVASVKAKVKRHLASKRPPRAAS